MKNIKSLLWIAALVALAGCDPFEETKGGAPRILSVMASGGDSDFGAGTVAEAAAPATATDPWVIHATSTCSVDEASAEVPGADQFVVFVKTNKLLDGFTIEQEPNTCVPFGVTEATPDATWFTVTALSGNTAITATPQEELSRWYSCYFPGTSTATEGASIVFYRAEDAREWAPAPTPENPNGDPIIPGDLATTGDSWFDIGSALPVRSDDRTSFAITGSVADKGGTALPINVVLNVHPDAGATSFAPTAINGATTPPELTITWTVGPCASAGASYAVQQLVGADPAAETSWKDVPGATNVTADGSIVVTQDFTGETPVALQYGAAYTYRFVETITGAETTEVFRKVANTDEGHAEFTQVILSTPEAPSLTVNGNAITVAWNAVTGAASYRVERAITGNAFVTAAEIPATTTNAGPYSFINAGLDPATSYDFRIVAVSAAGESLPGPAATESTPAAPPP